MAQPDRILLIDDGELSEVAEVLDALGLEYRRLRGGEIDERLAPPSDVLITTPRRAEVVRRGSPQGTPAGRPVRIIAVEEDGAAMPRMLRRMGFHLLVRLPSDESIWRLLIRRALYQGDERRTDERVAMGSPISLSASDAARSVPGARIMDISNRGCRIVADGAFELGTPVTIELPERATGEAPLALSGEVARVGEGDGGRCAAAVIFDEDMDEATRTRLGGIINRWSMGPPSIAAPSEGEPTLPPCESTEIPGLTLDDETDPAIRIGEAVAVEIASQAGGGVTDLTSDRREHARGAFGGTVVATSGKSHRVLMGRDLSAGGMRVERLPGIELGDELRLALYGPSPLEPFEVKARVVRDDGEAGLALSFEEVATPVAEALEKLVACLPEIESLEEDESHGMGAVISEILDEI